MYPLHFNYIRSPEQREKQAAVMRRISPIHVAIMKMKWIGCEVERIDISSDLEQSIKEAYSIGIEYPAMLFGFPCRIREYLKSDYVVVTRPLANN